MAISYQAKNSVVLGRELKVQELSIPFVVTASGTPASVSILNDEPAILYFQTQGVDEITPLITNTNDTLPTTYDGVLNTTTGVYAPGSDLPAANDSSGIFYAVLWIQEQLVKVVSADLTSRSQPGAGDGFNSSIVAGTVTDPAIVNTVPGYVQSVTGNGDKIYLLFSSADIDFATTNTDSCLSVKYIVQE